MGITYLLNFCDPKEILDEKIKSNFIIFNKEILNLNAADQVFKILTTEFNVIPNAIKPEIFIMLIEFCAKNNMLPAIMPQIETIYAFAEKYNFTDFYREKIFEAAINALQNAKPTHKILQSLYKILLDYIRKSKNLSFSLTKTLYQLSIQLFEVSQYNELLALPAYKKLNEISPQLHDLLDIFAYKGLAEFDTFAAKNADFLKEAKLQKEEIRKKLAMLLLCEMYSGNVEGRLTYKDISKAINLPESEIEGFIQEAVDYKILEAKMDQLEETVVICPRTKRIIKKQDWEVMSKSIKNAKNIVSQIINELPLKRSETKTEEIKEVKKDEVKAEKPKIEAAPVPTSLIKK